jgi:hypothetical protein
MEAEEDHVTNDITHPENSVPLKTRMDQKRDQAGNPNRSGKRMDKDHLLEEIFSCRKNNVSAMGADVVHQLKKRPAPVHIPENVGQND